MTCEKLYGTFLELDWFWFLFGFFLCGFFFQFSQCVPWIFLIDPTGETEGKCIESKQARLFVCFFSVFILYANYNVNFHLEVI